MMFCLGLLDESLMCSLSNFSHCIDLSGWKSLQSGAVVPFIKAGKSILHRVMLAVFNK